MRRKLAAGNWKMNGTSAALGELGAIAEAGSQDVDLLICPPATLLFPAQEKVRGSALMLGGQDCHAEESGAHTGDLSAPMLADAGARAVIVGHSERRADHAETDDLVRRKAEAAHAAGLIAVICLGEREDEREEGRALDVTAEQLAGSVPDGATAENTVIAYEPVWAIGTGRTASPDDIGEVHTHLRTELAKRFGDEVAQAMRIVYGGSVKPDNADEVFAVADVDGALVGGASLKADDFLPIVRALAAA